jgi:hypothetical protein
MPAVWEGDGEPGGCRLLLRTRHMHLHGTVGQPLRTEPAPATVHPAPCCIRSLESANVSCNRGGIGPLVASANDKTEVVMSLCEPLADNVCRESSGRYFPAYVCERERSGLGNGSDAGSVLAFEELSTSSFRLVFTSQRPANTTCPDGLPPSTYIPHCTSANHFQDPSLMAGAPVCVAESSTSSAAPRNTVEARRCG